MKQFLLYCILIVGFYLTARSQDTLPVKYFNEKFELINPKDSATATYHGICEPAERHFITTFYNNKQVKIATITYSSQELTTKEGEIAGFYEDGNIQFTANYSNNSLNGEWLTLYPDGQHCDSGKFKNNLPDGVWMSWYPNGQLRMSVQFSAKRFGEVKEELQKMTKQSSSGRQSTSQVRFGGTAPFYEENIYTLMQKSLQPVEIIGNSLRLCLKTKIDHNSITGFTYDVDYAPPFTQCLMHGTYKSFFPDGILKDYGYYDNGLRTGTWEEWNEDEAMRSSGTYKKGVRTGEWRHYSRFDKLVSVHWYP